VKQACDRFAPVEEDSDCTTETIPTSDPTLANAASTELQDTTLNNTAPESSQADLLAPPQTLVSNAANTVAEKSSGAAELVDRDWVDLPRNPAETETGLQATPASADAGLTNGSVGADVSAGVQENGAKKANGRRRHHHNRTRDGQQAQREGQQGPRDGQKSQREGQKPQREGEQGQREGQAPREGQRGRGRGPRGEGRGRGGRGRGRGGNGNGNGSGNGSAEASAPTPAAAAE
jgi:hypothetical protein